MKKIIFFAALLLGAVSCADMELDLDTNGGKGLEFAHFTATSATMDITEDNTTYTVVVGVTSLSDSARSFPVSIGAGTTGAQGTQFTLSSNTINIPAGSYTGSLQIDAVYDEIDEDGIIVELVLDADASLINPTYGNTLSVLLAPKVVFTWDKLVGNWTGVDDGEYEYPVSITQIDDTRCEIYNFWDAETTMEATVDFDANTIAIDPHQFLMEYPNGGAVYNVYLYAIVGGSYSIDSPIMGKLTRNGIIFDEYWVIGEDGDGTPTLNFGTGTTEFVR